MRGTQIASQPYMWAEPYRWIRSFAFAQGAGLDVEPESGSRMLHASVDAAGTRIHWAETGEQTSRTPVVLIHGLQDSHISWRRVAETLGRDRRVLMPDLPGHGMSERPDVGYDLPWYAHVMAAWLEVLGVVKVDLVGHSMGGGVAQMLLLESPTRIRRLVLAASGGLDREISPLVRLAQLFRSSWGDSVNPSSVWAHVWRFAACCRPRI